MKIRDATTPPGCFLASQERHLHVFYILPPQSTLRSLNATSVAKCKQLTCLCASPYHQGRFGNQSNSKNKSLLFRCKTKKEYSQCPERKRKGRGQRDRVSASVSQEIQSVESKTSVVSYCANVSLEEWLYLPGRKRDNNVVKDTVHYKQGNM